MGEVESPVALGVMVGETVRVQGSLRRPSAALDPPGLPDVEEEWATGRKRDSAKGSEEGGRTLAGVSMPAPVAATKERSIAPSIPLLPLAEPASPPSPMIFLASGRGSGSTAADRPAPRSGAHR